MEEDKSEEDELGVGLSNLDRLAQSRVTQDPYSLRNWLWYIECKMSHSGAQSVFPIYEEAVAALPRSYKLWHKYLSLRLEVFFKDVDITDASPGAFPISSVKLSDPEWEVLNGCFERSLFLCNKFPVIWQMYCSFLACQRRVTRCRRAFNEAIRSLPVVQHDLIWPLYIKFANEAGGKTAKTVWRRYLKIEPEAIGEYVEVALSLNPPLILEAANALICITEKGKLKTHSGKSSYYYWVKLCDILCEYVEETSSIKFFDEHLFWFTHGVKRTENLDVEKIIRGGISKFTDQVSRLWNCLARRYIAKGLYDQASDIYDEAIRKVTTAHDFSVIFDAYVAFMEEHIKSMMNANKSDSEDIEFDDIDIDIYLARLEKNLERRPFLLSDVFLRQNPNNALEWSRRARLYSDKGNIDGAVNTFKTAVETINPRRCESMLHKVYIDYAELFESLNDLEKARNVFEAGVQVPYRDLNDLVELWKKYIKMELKHSNIEGALRLSERATSPVGNPMSMVIKITDPKISSQVRLFKSARMWEVCLDLNEALGSFSSTKLAYERAIDLKVCTPQIIINYAAFLQENKLFEESFKVYERGIELFGYPVAYEIINVYLVKFVERYKSTKLERTRDMFESALEKCPKKYASNIYLLYANFEEEAGYFRHAIRIYDRALNFVDDKDLPDMYQIYINKAAKYLGVPYTRDIYQRAIETLPDKHTKEFCLKFAEVEMNLGEMDRARSIYVYASQICNPAIDTKFWKVWYNFEVKHGNEETFKEMLRIQRSVQMKFNTEAGYIATQLHNSEK